MHSIFSAPNPLLFGSGSIKAIGDKMREYGCKKALVVYDRGIKAAGIADIVIGVITDAEFEAVSFDEVQADPPDWSVEKAGKLAVDEGVDIVIGLGGGSSMDTAKGAKVLITNPAPLKQYFGREGVVTKPSVPLIVVPTTAGTGSECTPGGTITDTERGIKVNVSGVGAQVTLGIVDPELTANLPAGIAASTGMDALCHCTESYTSARANYFSSVMGRDGTKLVAKYLARAVKNGKDDREAREGMMLAASLGGMAMSGAFCHLSHDIGRSLGAKFHVPHGNGCAVTLPQVMRIVASVCPEKVKYIAECFGKELADNASPEEIGAAAHDAMIDLVKEIGLPSMKELGLELDELLAVVPDEVVMQAEMSAKIGIVTIPVPVTKELIEGII
ncbi:MAG: iron-containing alcohol dehydrogenase, partial [Clostridiales Family XIII bacterium]|nr:iron-containing alcohol dehydrogenase [Clostridiales Family XIII bacterium]